MKNNKGFTLIELLVAVAIMLSILTIAVISVTNLSQKQKANAYERVKDQILTAADDYFSSNEYLFEKEELDVSGGTTIITGYITLESLVKQGYLNVLTNPKTGEKIDKCNYVKLTKNNNVISTEYVEENGCDKDNKITYSKIVKDCPLEFQVVPEGNQAKKGSKWYTDNVTEKITVSTKTDETVTVTRKDFSFKFSTGSELNYTNETEADITTFSYAAMSSCGSEAYDTVEYGIDKTPPDIERLQIREGSEEATEYVDSTWTNKDIYNKFKIEDNLKLDNAKRILSGAVKRETSINVSDNYIETANWIDSGNGEIKLKIVAEDAAGNQAESVEYTIKRDTIPPTITYSDVSGEYSTLGVPTRWNNDNVTFSVSAKDSHSGINTSSNQINNALFYVKWDTATGYDYHYINSDGTKQAGGSATEVVANITESNGTYTRTNGGLGSEGRRWEIYKACDNAGNCGEKKIYVNIDKTPPTIEYIDTHEDKDKSGYVQIFSVDSGSALSWRKGEAKFNVEMTDGLSGIDTKKYEDEDGTKGFVEIKWNKSGSTEFGDDSKLVKSEVLFTNSLDKIKPITNGYKRIGGSLQAEGARHETYTVCDNADNCTTRDIYAKIDNTPPYTPWFTNEVLSKAYYRGVKCVKTDVDISNVNIAARDSYIPNFSAGSKSNYFNSAGSYSENNFKNQNKNIYCTVKKMGDGTNPLSFVDKYSSIVERQIIWRHNADSNPWQTNRNNEYTTWTKYEDFDVSYVSKNTYQEATYAIYILRIKDEAGNYSNAFRLDISPCYSKQSNKCGKGDSNDGTLYSGMW